MLFGGIGCQFLRKGAQMPDPQKEKTDKRSVSFPISLLERALERAEGSFSGYLQDLIRRDLDGAPVKPDPMSPSIVVDLTRVLCGELDGEEMADLLSGESQPRILRSLLDSERKYRLRLVAEGKGKYGSEKFGKDPHNPDYTPKSKRSTKAQ